MMEATKVTERPMEAHIPQEIICATKIVIATLPLYMLAWATTGVVVATQVVQDSVQAVWAVSDIIQEVMCAHQVVLEVGKGQ